MPLKGLQSYHEIPLLLSSNDSFSFLFVLSRILISLNMFSCLIFFLSILGPAIASAKLPLGTYTVENLGFVTDPLSNKEGVFHDGGGGATQNGYHVQVFADSMTTSDGFNFVHNSVAYYGFVCSPLHLLQVSLYANIIFQRNPKDPLNLYTFGMSGHAGKATFTTTAIGPQGNETELGSDFAIWMLSGMTPLSDGKTIVGVFPALNEATSTPLYTTMVSIEVVDPYSLLPGAPPPMKRLGNGRLFYPSEVNYGKMALVEGIDGYLYLIGSDTTGVKLARVPATPEGMADRNQYDYFNAQTREWLPQQPLELDNPVGNIILWSTMDLDGNPIGPDVGDLWFDNYHQTMVMTWGDSGIDGNLWFSYAENNNLEGPWSTPEAIWTPPVPSECNGVQGDWNYQLHAHPGWDPTGKTLLVSYASCTQYVSFAKIAWD